LLQINTGGGNWRLKWCPHDHHVLLAACMYNGLAVLRADDSYSSLSLVEEYKGHGSIAYGADWFRGQPEGGAAAGRCLVATCSFYDRLLHLWSPDTRAETA
jgi:diphthamide biosynthesis protein 7